MHFIAFGTVLQGSRSVHIWHRQRWCKSKCCFHHASKLQCHQSVLPAALLPKVASIVAVLAVASISTCGKPVPSTPQFHRFAGSPTKIVEPVAPIWHWPASPHWFKAAVQHASFHHGFQRACFTHGAGYLRAGNIVLIQRQRDCCKMPIIATTA